MFSNLIKKYFILSIVMVHNLVLSVVVNDIQLLSSNSKTDYVLENENYLLTCMYLLETEENVLYVQWDLNGMVIYIHKVDLEKPVASGLFKDKVDYTSKSTNSMYVFNATKELAGKYSCHVFTNLTSTAVTISRQVYIISDTCNEENWKTHTDMINCKEQISLNCKSIFPKPISTCALYNDYTGSIIKAETLTRLTSNKDKTFDMKIFANYDVNEIKYLNSPVSLRCKLTVQGTSWRKSFIFNLFAESICLLENDKKSLQKFLVKQEKNSTYNKFYENQVTILKKDLACLAGYREGTIIKANCISSKPILLCANASWYKVDESNYHELNDKLMKKEKIEWTKLKLNKEENLKCGSFKNNYEIWYSILSLIINFLYAKLVL